ncbi:MAG: aminomethyltransferase [Pirellulaceae bacterium]|nr:MAG: aminomethyltransferase [Pirellulaceae bacterium]
MPMDELLRTPIYEWHLEQGARMVEFAGWEMPIQYRSIMEEHHATRRQVGLFDISHMGRMRFDGPDAGAFLERLLSRRVLDMRPGAVRYALVTRDDGGVLDDVLVYRLADPADHFFLVVNAANRAKLLAWFAQHRRAGDRVTWTDETCQTAMFAVQGPRAATLVDRLMDGERLEDLRYYQAAPARVAGFNVLLSRTGYTGEDGCELVTSAEDGLGLWERLMAEGRALGGQAAGLGARDTLRLEAGMPLYGHELGEQINPLEAGLDFAVQCEGRTFPGVDILRAIQQAGPDRKRVGLKFSGRRVPRECYTVLDGDTAIGQVTSGTFSPTLDCPIAQAYLRADQALVGHRVEVDIRGHREPAEICRLPFYRRPKPPPLNH